MQNPFHANEVVTDYARTLIRVKAKQIVRQPGFSRSDQDDIEQDLVLHLLNQSQHFDPARGSLNTFVARVVTSGVQMLVRERRRIKRCPASVEIQSLEVKIEQADGPPTPLWATISPADLARRTGCASLSDAELYELVEGVASVIASLTTELQDVCRSLQERNRAETERELGLSRRGYEAAMIRIRNRFARSGLAKY